MSRSRLIFFFKYALNGLQRGGQRVVIALLAVAFGVMSLNVMASVADSIDRVLTTDSRVIVGGDLQVSAADGVFDADALETFQRLQQEGMLEAYTPRGELSYLLFRTENSGRAHFVRAVIGVDPSVYPLAGNWALSNPVDAAPGDLLRETGAALITRDLAAQYAVAVGDTLRLAQNNGDILPVSLKITGVLDDTPDHTGNQIYVNLDTLTALRDAAPFNDVIATTDQSAAVAARLESDGWSVLRADQFTLPPSESMDFFDFMLRGAGILGLMVGGIGIANTMQVLLARRREEIGVLKTLGYSGRDMIVLFVIEAGLLGLFGSLLGTLVGVIIARGITMLFANITMLLVVPVMDPLLIVGGVLVGVVTTILFAGYAILRASRVRPTVIFRNEAIETKNWRSASGVLGLYALLAVPFAVVTSLILGSITEGIGILLFALAGLVVLGIVLGGGTWLILRGLPVFNFHLLRMARNNMRKRAFSMLFAMIALFTGIFSLGFAATIIQSSLEQFEQRQIDDGSANLVVYTRAEGIESAASLLDEAGASRVDVRYQTPLMLADWAIDGRETAWDIEIIGGASFEKGGLYVWEDDAQETGASVDITLPDGQVRQITVVGRYRNRESSFQQNAFNPIVHIATLTDWGVQPTGAHVLARVDPAAQDSIAAQVGAALPDVMTLTTHDVDAQVQSTFRNLFAFALSMSALALLAGVMLVANVVSLALIERRYEIGVMKAVGYTRRHILITLALEYGLVGFIASAAGLLAVQITIVLITFSYDVAEGILWMSPTTALIVLALGMGLTWGTALLAAWQPTQIRPLTVLNARG